MTRPPSTPPPHGTAARYQGPRRHNLWEPCRCDDCRDAHRRQDKQTQLRHLRGVPSYADSTRVAAHVAALMDAGWKAGQIADAAQISVRSIWNLRNGTHAGVQHATARKLLALQAYQRPIESVPAVGTTRRLQALSTLGWSTTWCAREAGISLRYAQLLIAGQQDAVGIDIADRIARLYRVYSGRPGASPDAKRAARRHGWNGPLAWDDIDDPDEQPAADQVDETPRHLALAEDALWLERTQGYSRQHAAERLGVTRAALQKALDRARRAQAGYGEAA